MQAAKYGGLSGKARRARQKNRAARLHARQWIDEYFEPDDGNPQRHRYIPIRGRCEFVPTLMETASSHTAQGDGPRALPLGARDCDKQTQHSVEATRAVARKGRSSKADEAIRISRRSGPPNVDLPAKFRPRPRKPRATVGGFLLGCLMGSLAAGVLLLLLHAALR